MSLCLTLGLLATSALWVDEPAKPADKPQSDKASASSPQDKSGPTKSDAKRPLAPSDLNLLKSLEKQSAPTEPGENPLERVDQRMRDVQGRLAKSDPGDETQLLQKGIVDDLETLIEQIKKGGGCPTCGTQECTKHSKQKRQTSNQQAGKPGKPNQTTEPNESDPSAHPGDVSDEQKAAAARVVRSVWGHLPQKLREEMQQASQDTGLPKYRSLIELYFRAIAEQNDSHR